MDMGELDQECARTPVEERAHRVQVADKKPEAEQHLVTQARVHDAKALRSLGKYLLEVVAPDQADALIAAQLEREEAEALRTAYLTTWSDGHGSRHGRFKVPERHAAMLDAMLGAATTRAGCNGADHVSWHACRSPGAAHDDAPTERSRWGRRTVVRQPTCQSFWNCSR